MKQRLSLTSLLACGVALAMFSTVNAQVPTQGSATVLRIKGSARYTVGNNVWEPLKVGTVLRPGAVIQTGLEKGSYVDLALNNANQAVVMPRPFVAGSATAMPAGMPYRPTAQQNTVRAFENTILGVDKLTATETGADMVTETQLDLKSGRILGNVNKLSAASKYEVKLANGVAGIRGTVFHALAEGIIQVMSGSVVAAWVADGATKTQVVMAGEELDMRTGQIRRLSTDVMRPLESASAAMAAGGGQVVTYAYDRTVVPVSSTEGTTDSGSGDYEY